MGLQMLWDGNSWCFIDITFKRQTMRHFQSRIIVHSYINFSLIQRICIGLSSCCVGNKECPIVWIIFPKRRRGRLLTNLWVVFIFTPRHRAETVMFISFLLPLLSWNYLKSLWIALCSWKITYTWKLYLLNTKVHFYALKD